MAEDSVPTRLLEVFCSARSEIMYHGLDTALVPEILI